LGQRHALCSATLAASDSDDPAFHYLLVSPAYIKDSAPEAVDLRSAAMKAALDVHVTQAWRTFASYDAELRAEDITHLVSGRLKGNW
jgi:hypothetical protein